MTATPSKAPIFCSLNSRFASRRPSTSLRTLTCIILGRASAPPRKQREQLQRSGQYPARGLGEKRDVLPSDHHRRALAIPDGDRLGGIAVPGEIEPTADEPETIFC